MRFREIQISGLKEFIQSDWFKSSRDLPITTHRAKSHLKNPRANPDDVSLILALDDEDALLGYIGILPDNFAVDGTHAGWLSCWWIHPEKGKKVGFSLFLQALICWDHRLIITDFTPQILEIIRKTGMFRFLPTRFGLRGYLGFNLSEILPRKRKVFTKLKPALIMIDVLMNSLNKIRLKLIKHRYTNQGLKIAEIDAVSNELAGFISELQVKEYFKRSAKEFNWILNNRWVLEGDETAKNEGRRYYFSSSEKNFRYRCLSFRSGGLLVAFVMLRQRNSMFTCPYLYCRSGFEADVINAVYFFLIESGALEFTVFHSQYVDLIQSIDSPFIYRRKIPKDFALSNELAHLIDPSFFLQDGDGDYVFA